MDGAGNQSGTTGAHRRQIDFAPSKPLYPPLKTSDSAHSSANHSNAASSPSAQPTGQISSSEADHLAHMVANLPSVGGNPHKTPPTQPPHPNPTAPTSSGTPVTSAKAAINAMYAERAKHSSTALAPSARELVNASAGFNQLGSPKSAASFHHGSIQRSMESTRTSASAILKMAKAESPEPEDLHALGSADPLTSASAVTRGLKKVDSDEVPVVRTSLKLGTSKTRQPKQTAVVLPANSRMAQAARSVDAPELPARVPNRIARLIGGRRQPMNRPTLGSGRPRTLASGARPSNSPSQPYALGSGSRDPQMVTSFPQSDSSARFRSKPKGYSVSHPKTAPADETYIVTTPPKITPSRPRDTHLGVVEDYRPSRTPTPLGDKASSSETRTAQRIAAGQGGPAYSNDRSFQADATAKYSFLEKPKKSVDNNRYALGGQSPFLKSVSVEKRPLSNNAKPYDYSVRTSEKTGTKSGAKLSKKNIYPKKSLAKTSVSPRLELPTRPTVIIPASRRSKLPLFFLLLFTILLGVVVGAAVYLCFFQ